MHDPAYFRLMADYNRWMNGKLYAICEEIPDEERKRDRGAFFRSIHGTLNHLLFADLTWLSRFRGENVRYGKLGDELHADFAELRRERERVDAELVAWAAGLPFGWLEGSFSWRSGVDGKTRTLPAWIVAVHLFNHQAHHRGQVTTLLSQLGIDPGVTDLPWLPGVAAEE